ncbi:MAG: hypothetical protein ACOX2L_06825 [Anaerolineae bacterium]|jgi:hypothetical protein|nr:hypothetical protein [Chloroflexota bacterium]
MSTASIAGRALDQGDGILSLAPNWVPRSFCIPGRRLKLHPDDYYSLGADRGGIDERWFASTVPADNGPGTPTDEGLSYVILQDGADTQRVTFAEAISVLGAQIIGQRLMDGYGRWPMFSKFFDNLGPLPHHIHQMAKDAARVGQQPKPEAYFFPTQLNNHPGRFPHTFFGLEPGTTPEQVRQCLENWNVGDNKILSLSRAYTLQPGTGWDVPAGVLHAPGSLLTYEPQADSDVFAMFQSLVDLVPIDRSLLVKNVPTELEYDLDYIVGMLDWELNVDPEFRANRFMAPLALTTAEEAASLGYCDQWIAYRSSAFSAKQTTILPGRQVTLKDGACYGLIAVQGHGQLGKWSIETPAMIRFGELTRDEFFVSEQAALQGVTVRNDSTVEPLVLLRHFGPGNPDLKLSL